MGHKPFLVLSDYLTRQGIAVLRYDLLPLNTFGQELRGGLRNAEQALFDEPPEFPA